ncbi:MFS transporter [soil metagenome]
MSSRTNNPRLESSSEIASPVIERALRISIYEGCATQIYLNWTTNAVLAGFLTYMGATPSQLAMASGIPQLAQCVAPLAAWLQARYPHRRAICTSAGFLSRTVWIIPAIAPMLVGPKEAADLLWDHAAAYLLGVIAFSSVFASIVTPVWTAWMGDVVPQNRRGRYFGLRSGILAVAGMAANICAGMALDEIARPWNYQVFLIGAVIFAGVGLNLYRKQYEPRPHVHRTSLLESIRIPLRDHNFRRFLMFSTYWQASVMIGAVFVFPYFITTWKLTYTQIGIYQAVYAIMTLLFGPLWGKIADHAGNRAVLSITTLIAGSLLPMTWILGTPGDPTMLWVSAVVDAFAWSAINPAVFNLSLATAPPKQRMSYLGVLAACTGIAGFAGASIAGPLLEFCKDYEFSVSGWHWTGYQWIFLISACFRSCAFFFVLPVQEAKAWRTRDLLRALMPWNISGFPWK